MMVGLCAASAQTAMPPLSTPSRDVVVQWLGSPDAQLRAWGAHFARESRAAADYREPLLKALAQWTKSSALPEKERYTSARGDSEDATALALDAVMQLEITPSLELVQHLVDDFPVQSAILLTRLPKEQQLTLAWRWYEASRPKHTDGDHAELCGCGVGNPSQYVATVLLARAHPKGFAGKLLSDVEIAADVDVQRPDDLTGHGAGTGYGCSLDGGPEFPRQKWPPIYGYSLMDESKDGYTALLAEPNAVYYERKSGYHHNSDSYLRLNAERRRSLLAEMLGEEPENIGLELSVHDGIRYESQRQFEDELQAFIDRTRETHRSLAMAFVALGQMDADKIEESLPWIKLTVIDERVEWKGDPQDKPKSDLQLPYELGARVEATVE